MVKTEDVRGKNTLIDTNNISYEDKTWGTI
jgi:hypothetical protein